MNSPSKIPELSRPASATPSSKGQEKTTRSGSRSRILKTPESPLEPVKKGEQRIVFFELGIAILCAAHRDMVITTFCFWLYPQYQ